MLCILTEPSCLQLFCPKTKANLECKKRSRLNYWVVVWLPAQYIKLESNHWSRNISFDALKSFSISFQKTIELKNVLILSIQNKCPINGKKVEEPIYKINGLCKMTIRIPIEKKTLAITRKFKIQYPLFNIGLERMTRKDYRISHLTFAYLHGIN